jgi:hypothetical protein
MENLTMPIIYQMRILIQNPDNKAYLSGDTWDDDENHDTEFGNVAQAEEFCRQQNLPLALVVVKFKNPVNDVRYPVNSPDSALLKKYSTRRIR